MAVGKYVTYQVDSTIYDDFLGLSYMHSYQMRYDVADTFTDAEGRPSFIMTTMVRAHDTDAWVPGEVLYVTPTNLGLEYVQQSLRFRKLVTPVQQGYTWKGNSLIATSDQDYQYLDNWDYTYTAVAAPYNNGHLEFDNTITVNEQDYSLNIPYDASTLYAERTFAKEIYAKDVGLVYREITHYVLDRNVAGFPKGYSVVMYATDHN